MELVLTNLNTFTDIIPLNHETRLLLHHYALGFMIFIFFFITFNLLSKFIKAHIAHEAVPIINQFRLVNSVWRVIFSTWTIVLFFITIGDVNKSSFKSILLQAALPQCNYTILHTAKEDVDLEVPLLIAPVSFFLHQLYISISSFTEPAVIPMGCLSLFVYSTNYLKCPNLCLQILFLLALNVGTLDLARTICALKSRRKGFTGPPPPLLLRLLAFPLFIIHIIVWVLTNFYLFPLLYFSLPSVTKVEPSLRMATAYINIFLIFYAQKQFFDSVAWSLMKLAVRKPSETGKIRGLQSLPVITLLPYTSPLLPELRTIQIKFLLDALPTSAERRMMRKKILSSGGESSAPISEGKADLLSIVKCVKILKRKMRYRYEQKTANENLTSDSEQSSLIENSPEDDASSEVSASTSRSTDVTDIFISVPHLQTRIDKAEEDSIVHDEQPSNRGLEITADVHMSAEETDQKTDASDDAESGEAIEVQEDEQSEENLPEV